MKVCSKCGVEKSVKEYYVKSSASGRLHAHCKDCYRQHRKTYYRTHYENYGDAYRERARKRRKMIRDEYKDNMLMYLEGKFCAICGESDIRTLEFDHLEPHKKSFSISQARKLGYRWQEVLKEIQKCRILCSNCHKKHTAEQAGWYKK